MNAPATTSITRRLALRRGLLAGGGFALLRARAAAPAAAQGETLTASGGGVNLKLMPSPDGKATVPMRESFSFDPHYAQCVVEDTSERFAMDAFGMGKVVIEPHRFFMAMYANDVSLVGVYNLGGGKRLAKLTGDLGCSTEAGAASGTVGSRTAQEPAFFDIAAVDGGHGGGAAGDSFTFTGEMIAGEITIAPAMALPVVPGTPAAGTPTG